MTPFLLNLILALLWTFLSPEPSLPTFALGFALGFGCVAVGERLFPGRSYKRRLLAQLAFLGYFVRAFVASNVVLVKAVLFRSRNRIDPNFVEYDVSGLTPVEIVVLSHCITLTPGTTTVNVSSDRRTLLLHAFDAGDPEEVRLSIDTNLKIPLLRCTR